VALERFGVGTLGELAALPRAAVADRFGPAGLRAHDLAQGHDTPLRARAPLEALVETLDLPESASGVQLERALALLVDRLLARRERRGRTLRAVVLSARLVEGGTWRERVVFREALADPVRMRLALGARLALLPAPAESVRLAVERFGPPHAAGGALFEDGATERRGRLREAVRQARAAAGPEAALRVLAVDPESRIPERRAVLTPFEL
jgi:protein ImuB